MKKKILAILLAAMLIPSVTACGSKAKKTETDTKVESTKLVSDKVTISGKYGKATKVSSKEVKLSDYQGLSEYINDKITGSIGYDITIKDKSGKAVQPSGKVDVTVNTKSISTKNSAYVVYYVADDGKFEKMNVTKSDDKTVTFNTTHFSVYLICAFDKTQHRSEDFVVNSDAVKTAEAEQPAENKQQEAETSKEKAPEKQTNNTRKSNNIQPGGGTSATAPSGTTLEENIAYAKSLGYTIDSLIWINDTDYYCYRVYNKHGGGCTPPADLDRPGYAVNLDIYVTVYSDANMDIVRETWHLTGEIPVYPGD